MKKLLYIPAFLLLAACNNNKPKDKATQLADLKKEQAKIDSQIVKLQTELGKKKFSDEILLDTGLNILTLFADNFAGGNMSPNGAKHRPCGLAQGPDGSLYVSDDSKGTVWKISFKK